MGACEDPSELRESDPSDRQQAERPCSPDDRQALEALIAANSERLLTRIRHLMGPEARQNVESGDVLHDTLSMALEPEGPSPRDELLFLRWMTAIARHRIIDEVRRRRAEPFDASAGRPAASENPSMCSLISRKETHQGLMQAFDELEPVRQRVVRLRCVEELSWRSIARELHRSEEAVRKLYHRSLLELGRGLARRNLGVELASARE